MKRPAGRALVFLGPSLTLAEARSICPDAEFHPPVRFGDLYALIGEPPGQVLIVDGVFHESTPVWQREILELLQAGWRVLGAASMGALRALELAPYGMIGLGTVFEWYRAGRIEGDDEVALIHGVAEMGYRPLTLPLVDVREALAGLRAEGVLTSAQASDILFSFKHTGHEERTLSALLSWVQAAGADVAAVRDRLSDPDQTLKARDARLALRVLAGQCPPPAPEVRWPDPRPAPAHPEAVLYRRVRPLTGPPVLVADLLRVMARQPEEWSRPLRESRRRWFLGDWSRVTGQGPGAGERRDFAVRRATGMARALGVSLSRWCAASALREDELAAWMAGLAIEAWLGRQSAGALGIAHPLHGDEPSLIPAVLVDWMRRHGIEAPTMHRASTGHMASWLVQAGPGFFGAEDFHADAALVRTLAASGHLARRGRAVLPRAEAADLP
ncbi:MAG: TfuA-like protein [Rhodospirillales bacterium]|nr:TfuA-like protein [Rhodospirillales bacterium]